MRRKRDTTGFKCVQCGTEVECFFNEENIKSYVCYNCGMRYDVETVDDEEKENYPYYNSKIEDTTENKNHGCDMRCPVCNYYTVLIGNFLRSEVCGDVDEDGPLMDDSIVMDIICPNCGTSLTVIPCKPSEEKEYPFFKDKGNNDKKK